MSCLDPTLETISNAGVGKTKQTTTLNLVAGSNAGVWIAVGGMLGTIAYGRFAALGNIGLGKFMFAAVFPIGLIGIIVMGGADLFTGDCSVTPFAGMTKKSTWSDVFKNWVGALAGNFIGSVIFAWIVALALIYAVGSTEANFAIAIAKIKTNVVASPADYSVFFATYLFKGIICNFLVNWAVWQAFKCGDQHIARIVAIWFPIFAFVAVGSEHLIANMFFIPVGIFSGATTLWSSAFIWNFLPVLIGNIIGGFVFIGINYWFTCGAKCKDDDPKEEKRSAQGLLKGISFVIPMLIGTAILAVVYMIIPYLVCLAMEVGSTPGDGIIAFGNLANPMTSLIIPAVLIVYYIIITIIIRPILGKIKI
jgi:formate/nitrite transporter